MMFIDGEKATETCQHALALLGAFAFMSQLTVQCSAVQCIHRGVVELDGKADGDICLPNGCPETAVRRAHKSLDRNANLRALERSCVQFASRSEEAFGF